MGQRHKSFPICGKKDLLHLYTHLRNVHCLNSQDRKQWLKEAHQCMSEETSEPSTMSAEKMRTILMTCGCYGIQHYVHKVIIFYIDQVMGQEKIGFQEALQFTLEQRGPTEFTPIGVEIVFNKCTWSK